MSMVEKNKQGKMITKDIVLILAVIAGLVSFFYNPQGVDMQFLRTIMGAVVGYFIGIKDFPIFRAKRW